MWGPDPELKFAAGSGIYPSGSTTLVVTKFCHSDAVAGAVSLAQQVGGARYRPLSYQLEREVRSCPAPTFQPSRHLLQSLLARGQAERDSLQEGSGEQHHLAETEGTSETGMGNKRKS